MILVVPVFEPVEGPSEVEINQIFHVGLEVEGERRDPHSQKWRDVQHGCQNNLFEMSVSQIVLSDR